MLVIPGGVSKDTCDGVTRREMLRVGGSAMFGLSLAGLLRSRTSVAGQEIVGGQGFGKAKSVILVYLQGGPSHLDLWDPKTDVPDNVRSVFKPIDTRLPGIQFTELRRLFPSNPTIPRSLKSCLYRSLVVPLPRTNWKPGSKRFARARVG